MLPDPGRKERKTTGDIRFSIELTMYNDVHAFLYQIRRDRRMNFPREKNSMSSKRFYLTLKMVIFLIVCRCRTDRCRTDRCRTSSNASSMALSIVRTSPHCRWGGGESRIRSCSIGRCSVISASIITSDSSSIMNQCVTIDTVNTALCGDG